MNIRVVIADDQELVRDGFALILDSQAGIEVVGSAADGAEAISLCIQLRPDVALLDVRMPNLDGIAAARQIVSSTETKVIMLTTFDLDEYVYDAFRAGACGFLLKDVPRAEVIHAVRSAADGGTLLAPAITRRLVEQFVAGPAPGRPAELLKSLTAREVEILTLIGRGHSNTKIAGLTCVAEATVKTHIGRIFYKLGLRDRVQAVVIAYETGLVRTGEQDDRPGLSSA